MKEHILWIIVVVILCIFIGTGIYLADTRKGVPQYYEHGWEVQKPLPYAAGLQNQ